MLNFWETHRRLMEVMVASGRSDETLTTVMLRSLIDVLMFSDRRKIDEAGEFISARLRVFH